MLNESDYNLLLENVSKIEKYLTEKVQGIHEPTTIRFGDEEKTGYTTSWEYRLNIDQSGFEIADNHHNLYRFESPNPERKTFPGCYYTNVYLYGTKQCATPERMMIKLLRDWQEIKSAINITLREQREIRDMIHNFTL